MVMGPPVSLGHIYPQERYDSVRPWVRAVSALVIFYTIHKLMLVGLVSFGSVIF